jgi:Fe-S-cluster containining protein
VIDYPRTYFFDNGILFGCQRCGACCCGAPGTVYLARHEVAAVARHLAMEVERFIARFLFPFRDSYSVREHSDGRCLFYDKGCLIYPVRPFQCRSYPFWLEFLRSVENWSAAAAECPGIGQGKRFSRDEILDWLDPAAANSE